MSSTENSSEIQRDLIEEKQSLLNKLLKIFDPETAIDFVSPKTFETRHHLTIEELINVDCDQSYEHMQRLRSMEHYQTTTQSLSRADLEASYQAFVRDQVGQQYSRDELEQFVRNSSDIDTAKRCLDPAKRCLDPTNDVLINPGQSNLLFHSSKLNEQRANLLKSATTTKSLKQLNDDASLQKYFPQISFAKPKYRLKQKESSTTEQNPSYPPSTSIEHREKKYRITFLKPSDKPKLPYNSFHHSTNNRDLLLMKPRNVESLFSADISTVLGSSTPSNIHREIFPPLSITALKEYRPSVTPNSLSTSQTKSQQHGKMIHKSEFIWEQSIVSPRHE